jgi:hypothetical protein
MILMASDNAIGGALHYTMSSLFKLWAETGSHSRLSNSWRILRYPWLQDF